MVDVIFLILSVSAVAASVIALQARELIYGAVALGVALLATAGLFVLLDAPFVAMFQVTVFIGAIVVLILFTVMLVKREQWIGGSYEGINPKLSVIGGIMVVAGLMYAGWASGLVTINASEEFGITFLQIGRDMMSGYAPALILVAITLAAALIGALTMAKVEKEG
uniref:NADH-quinone oxidoreductase subunit J n=1 Tax=uncultured marine thaumarchaeote KM3_55_F05 TaxID=1456198 RepID=A0A075H7E5_9ARCH|nr:hypothetical protein [uncultured marine thaumarchaeote KM3_55_F05]